MISDFSKDDGRCFHFLPFLSRGVSLGTWWYSLEPWMGHLWFFSTSPSHTTAMILGPAQDFDLAWFWKSCACVCMWARSQNMWSGSSVSAILLQKTFFLAMLKKLSPNNHWCFLSWPFFVTLPYRKSHIFGRNDRHSRRCVCVCVRECVWWMHRCATGFMFSCVLASP